MSIRTDHGREFDNEVKFGAFCDANGITHNFSAPRTQQSNGVVERKNRTLREMSRTMLNEQSIPQNDDDIIESQIIEKQIEEIEDKVNGSLNKEIRNIKESKDHPRETVIESKNVKEAIKDESWTMAMQEELNQFISDDVWSLVPPPENQTVIGAKWVFKNKLDENGVVAINKARLVAQGYNHQEGIDCDDTYTFVARLESIIILLAYDCTYDFKLFQMDVKSVFLNGFINEEVYQF
ncbi:retrovirus-related pol polyprotein from transposon TNT 1-94 [Tanacetum coccineum]